MQTLNLPPPPFFAWEAVSHLTALLPSIREVVVAQFLKQDCSPASEAPLLGAVHVCRIQYGRRRYLKSGVILGISEAKELLWTIVLLAARQPNVYGRAIRI